MVTYDGCIAGSAIPRENTIFESGLSLFVCAFISCQEIMESNCSLVQLLDLPQHDEIIKISTSDEKRVLQFTLRQVLEASWAVEEECDCVFPCRHLLCRAS